MVLLTMGGVDWDYGFLRQLEDREDGFFVVPGASAAVERRGCLVTLPKRSSFYHPDLVHASDLVVGKLGYSTLAEVFAAGCAFAFVARPRFPESPLLARFALREMPATEISEDELTNGAWLDRLGALLAQPRTHDSRPNGAAEAAQLVGDLLENTG